MHNLFTLYQVNIRFSFRLFIVELKVVWYADCSIRQHGVVSCDVKIQISEIQIARQQSLHAFNHQLGRDVIVFEQSARVQFHYAFLVQITFDIFISEKDATAIISEFELSDDFSHFL